jgi:hypothetical protein
MVLAPLLRERSRQNPNTNNQLICVAKRRHDGNGEDEAQSRRVVTDSVGQLIGGDDKDETDRGTPTQEARPAPGEEQDGHCREGGISHVP